MHGFGWVESHSVYRRNGMPLVSKAETVCFRQLQPGISSPSFTVVSPSVKASSRSFPVEKTSS